MALRPKDQHDDPARAHDARQHERVQDGHGALVVEHCVGDGEDKGQRRGKVIQGAGARGTPCDVDVGGCGGVVDLRCVDEGQGRCDGREEYKEELDCERGWGELFSAVVGVRHCLV